MPRQMGNQQPAATSNQQGNQQGNQGNPPSAFRAAEKRYQRHLEQLPRGRRGRGRKAKALRERPTDLSAVLDARRPAGPLRRLAPAGDEIHDGEDVDINDVEDDARGAVRRAAVYALEGHPGFHVLPGAVPPAAAARLLGAALAEWPEPPARSNHHARYGAALSGLWAAAQRGRRLVPAGAADGSAPGFAWSAAAEPEAEAEAEGGVAAGRLLRKLRWVTLGPHFDWTRRRYQAPHGAGAEPFAALPAELAALGAGAVERVRAAGGHLGLEGAAPFVPDAALVNYYGIGDTLGGHCDDAEHDLDQPIVTVSLGWDAVFLLGGATRAVAPAALRVRSGDVLVLAGPARRCFHGCPRILEPEPEAGGLWERLGPGPLRDYVAAGSRVNVSIRRVC